MERWREEGREGSGDERRSPLMVDGTTSNLQEPTHSEGDKCFFQSSLEWHVCTKEIFSGVYPNK